MQLFVKSGFMFILLGGPASLLSCHLQIKIWWRLTAKGERIDYAKMN